MPALRDKRTGHWAFRKMVTFPDGMKRRVYGVATDYGQKNTRLGAEEAERLAIARIRETGSSDPTPPTPGAPAAKEVPTIEEFVSVWLARAKADNKPSTYEHKELTAKNHIIPTFGKLRLDQVTFDLVDDWRVGLDGKLKPATIARVLNEFHSLMNLARKRRHILELPEWPHQAAPLPRPKFLTFEELDRLIAAADPMDPWKAMVIVAARTGLRHGELTALRWEDVDLDAGRLVVVENYVNGITGTPKSGKDREVPLSNDAIKALRALARHKRGPLVFCSPKGGHLEPWVTASTLSKSDPGLLSRNDPGRVGGRRRPPVGDGRRRCAKEATVLGVSAMVLA